MVQGNHQGGVSAALQQLQSRSQQTPVVTLLDDSLNLVTEKSPIKFFGCASKSFEREGYQN